ncbi:MAG: hypothetical protein A2Y17_11180 [Clostridiales bacterium GWF2_38_85]|nr:MAG: hypothetical protein A2Y17_11180 [Clostridiales bacterium GWF2_38_85]HBL84688.1 hypothetical protein [Clostridiales bacterium]
MKIELKTERLIIRNFVSDDWKSYKFVKELKDFFIAKESSPYAVYDSRWPTDDDSILKMAEWMPQHNHHLAICLPSDNTFIGYIFHMDGDNGLGIGYAIHSAYQNNGYGTEAVRGFIDYAFHNMGAKCVLAGTANNNIPSVRLLEKLNFKKVNEHAQSHRQDKQGNPINFIESLYTYSLK